MLHYSKKLEELRGVKTGQKNLDEKVDRNKEKYAQASQALRDQTNQLMSVFAHAEQLRQRLLTQDMPAMIACEKEAFGAFSANLNKAAEEDGSQPRLSPATAVPHRLRKKPTDCIQTCFFVKFFFLAFVVSCTPAVRGKCLSPSYISSRFLEFFFPCPLSCLAVVLCFSNSHNSL